MNTKDILRLDEINIFFTHFKLKMKVKIVDTVKIIKDI